MDTPHFHLETHTQQNLTTWRFERSGAEMPLPSVVLSVCYLGAGWTALSQKDQMNLKDIRLTPSRSAGNDRTASAGPAFGEPPYRWAALSALGVGTLYVLTLAPTTAFWDTSEYIATGHILGIPHPPGNPLFVVLARTWDILLTPLGLTVATHINLFSALMSSLAHGLWFLTLYHVLGFFSESRPVRLLGALAATLLSATAFTVWNQSNVNEKVYTVSLCTIALLTWLAFRWRENLGKGRDDNLLVLMAFILALSVGNHLMAFLAAPALAVFILLISPRTLLNWRLYVVGAVAVCLGLSIHLFLPLRSALDPVINEADPTCSNVRSALASIVTWGQAGCAELSAALTRQQYDKPDLLPRLAPLWAQYANYLQYFDWQWARGIAGSETVFPLPRLPFTVLFVGLGAIGATQHIRRDPASGLYTLILFGTLSVGLVFYLNFEYGYSFASPTPGVDDREVRERDYFFIVGFSIWGLWAGLGITVLWHRLAKRLGGSLPRAAPVLCLALLPLLFNWSWATRRGDYSARDWGYNLLMSVEPYAVLFTNGDNDTFPLWYLQEVEGIRRDVTVIVTSYLNTDWYTKQIRDLTRPCPDGVDPEADRTRITCQRPYRRMTSVPALYTSNRAEAEAGGKVAIVTDTPVIVPERAILALDDTLIERVAGPAGYVRVDESRDFTLGPVIARLDGGTVVFPWQQFALALIQNSIGDRPIYFASSGNAARSLGLVPYLVRQGLAFRLNPGPPDSSQRNVPIQDRGIVPVTGLWLDEERTRTLVDQVFVHRGGIPDAWPHWPDRSTIGIPNYYAWTYAALVHSGRQRGDPGAAAPYEERLAAWQALAR